MYKYLLTLTSLWIGSSALATSLSVSSGFGDALINLNGGLGLLALEAETDLSPHLSVSAGLGYSGAIYTAAGAQYHFQSSLTGPFLGARASYFDGAGLSGYGLNLLAGLRQTLPAPRDERDARMNGRGQFDIFLGFSPYYQSSAVPELNGWHMGISLGARVGFRFGGL